LHSLTHNLWQAPFRTFCSLTRPYSETPLTLQNWNTENDTLMVKHCLEPLVLVLELWHANNAPPWTCVLTLALTRKDWPVAVLARTRQLISTKKHLELKEITPLWWTLLEPYVPLFKCHNTSCMPAPSRIAMHRLTHSMARRELPHLEQRLMFWRLLHVCDVT